MTDTEMVEERTRERETGNGKFHDLEGGPVSLLGVYPTSRGRVTVVKNGRHPTSDDREDRRVSEVVRQKEEIGLLFKGYLCLVTLFKIRKLS